MKVMRHIQKMILLAACSSIIGALNAATTKAKVSLQDGSVLIGEPVKDKVKLYFIDGKRMCSSRIKPYVVRGRAWATGQTLLTIADPCTTPQSAVIIDDLKVWNHPKSDF